MLVLAHRVRVAEADLLDEAVAERARHVARIGGHLDARATEAAAWLKAASLTRRTGRAAEAAQPAGGSPSCQPSHRSGSTRGRATHAVPPRIAISGGSGCERKNGMDSVCP